LVDCKHRFISLEHGNGPCVTKGLAACDQQLDSNEDGNYTVNIERRMFKAQITDSFQSREIPSVPELKEFERLANITDLLGKVLVHVHDPTPHQDFNSAEAIQLMKTLTSFQSILKEETSRRAVFRNSARAVCQWCFLPFCVL
jgi:hypothetical protein